MILCASVFCFRANAEVTPQLDSASYAALGQKLDEYLRRIEPLDFHTQEEECDFLISSCKDSAARQFTALKVYTHYLHSKVMGAEAVAIYLTDNWFAPGKVQMHSSIDLMNAKIFADFNRQSPSECGRRHWNSNEWTVEQLLCSGSRTGAGGFCIFMIRDARIVSRSQ